MHPNERLLRREYDARAQRDDASLAALLTEAVVWHVPGRARSRESIGARAK